MSTACPVSLYLHRGLFPERLCERDQRLLGHVLEGGISGERGRQFDVSWVLAAVSPSNPLQQPQFLMPAQYYTLKVEV